MENKTPPATVPRRPEFRIYKYSPVEGNIMRFKVVCKFPGGGEDVLIDNLPSLHKAQYFLKVFMQGYRFQAYSMVALFHVFNAEEE